jgi:hypothetical protein
MLPTRKAFIFNIFLQKAFNFSAIDALELLLQIYLLLLRS